MLTRPRFLKLAVASIAMATAPRKIAAATPYSIDVEYRYDGAGLVRSVRFPRTSQRDAVQCDFAALLSDHVKAAIVSGSQLSIPGLQLWSIADRHHAIVAVNGGFFQTNSFGYDGLLVIDGQQIEGKNSQYSGAVVVDVNGILSLQRINDVSHPASAMQTGPFIIDPGGTMGMHSKTYDLFRRSFIAQSGKTIVTGVTSPISLYQLAALLLQFPDAFEVDRFDAALNLSGAASAGFFAKLAHDDIRDGGSLNSPAVITFAPL